MIEKYELRVTIFKPGQILLSYKHHWNAELEFDMYNVSQLKNFVYSIADSAIASIAIYVYDDKDTLIRGYEPFAWSNRILWNWSVYPPLSSRK